MQFVFWHLLTISSLLKDAIQLVQTHRQLHSFPLILQAAGHAEGRTKGRTADEDVCTQGQQQSAPSVGTSQRKLWVLAGMMGQFE